MEIRKDRMGNEIIIFVKQIKSSQMLYAESDYKSVPDILAAFAKQYKKEHFHIHGGSHHNSAEDTLFSVFKDDTNQLHQGARLAIKGSLIGLLSGAFYLYNFGGKQNQFVHTRRILGKISFMRKLPSYGVLGALFGLSWWTIHDMFLCPHGRESTMQREILAHAIQGGIVLGTLYHPAAFGYGMLAGVAVGLLNDASSRVRLPKNFQLYFPNFDEEKRRNKLRDDEEYELSLRSVLHPSAQRVFHPI